MVLDPYHGIVSLTSKELDLKRIPMIEAQPFMWEFRCLGRIVPATDTLGNHSALLFVFELAQVIKNDYKMGAHSLHSKHHFLESNPASPSFVVTLNKEDCFLEHSPFTCRAMSCDTFSTIRFFSVPFFNTALAIFFEEPCTTA